MKAPVTWNVFRYLKETGFQRYSKDYSTASLVQRFAGNINRFSPKLYSTETCHSDNIEPSFVSPVLKARGLIPRTKDEIMQLQSLQLTQPEEPRILEVAILGLPNSGKSTITNKLMGWRVCSVSKKCHTTKHNTKAIYSEGNTQIIFLDTPGLISPSEKNRFQLEESLLVDPEKSLKTANIIVVLVDSANKYTRQQLDSKILRLLLEYKNKKSILVLNKVDKVKPKRLLLDIANFLTLGRLGNSPTATFKKPGKQRSGEQLIRQTFERLGVTDLTKQEEDLAEVNPEISSGWPYFDKIFMVSALEEDGIGELKSYLLSQAVSKPWKYPSEIITDEPPHDIVIMAIREKFLDCLYKEIPYSLNMKIELWEVDEHGVLRIVVLVSCRKNLVKIVIGPGGRTVAQVAEEARQAVMNTFRCDVSLKLVIKEEKDH